MGGTAGHTAAEWQVERHKRGNLHAVHWSVSSTLHSHSSTLTSLPYYSHGTLTALQRELTLLDFMDKLPIPEEDQAPLRIKGLMEERQCIPLHVAAAILWTDIDKVPKQQEVFR